MAPQPIQIEPERELAVTLQAQDWQIVLHGLRELPFRLSAPVIARLEAGLGQAAQQQEMPARSNGAGEQTGQHDAR